MNKKSLESLAVTGKRVLVRVDYNVPLQDGKIADDTRIVQSLETLRYLLKQNAALVLCSHLGRPKGTVNPKYSLQPVVKRLEELLGRPVAFAKDCIGEETVKAAQALKPGQVLLLENLRYHPEEEKNVESFAKELARLADFFVQDAFGAVHRAHASTSAITKFLPSAAGYLLKREIDCLEKVLKDPQKPFVAILGGAKVSDKIAVIENLLPKADSVYIGGAMAYTLLKAKGVSTGNSLVEADKVDLARNLLSSSNGKKLVLPTDHTVTQKVEKGSAKQTTANASIQDGWIGVDVGPASAKEIGSILENAKTIIWNGPMGVFEIPEFSDGTFACAKAIAKATDNGAYSIVGGGDSVSALKQSGLSGKVSHVSTGGGASLEFLEGKALPGVEALPNA